MAFPRKCVQCGSTGKWVCATCQAQVHWMQPPLCECCGREVGAGNRCQDCARDRPNIDGIRACSRFEGAIREAVHRLKYNGQRALADPLAGYLAPLATSLPDVDALVPLPLHPKRERQRGYNQASLLAASLGERLRLPVLPIALRTRDTESQVGKSRRERVANVRGAFACTAPEQVGGRRLLLVDDVCTTGSTLVACAEPLFRAKAESVWGLVVARQDYERT
ncbi:MAG TPA: ComF family protein [Chloroflexota bacterium]|nr:ComF family protein [Chloroflexota bacterium]